ncbi:aspartic proteinase nepenthesin-1-like [Lycium barbarum]|uniref:aspartic proteinase nepenthesin-1-like n=1 Tax=Lycium barbarum TaxID=112863 RepID=UPI00293E32A5|nr:aspartic proteinase nepenthesin-1-like [Lycium barbarum]
MPYKRTYKKKHTATRQRAAAEVAHEDTVPTQATAPTASTVTPPNASDRDVRSAINMLTQLVEAQAQRTSSTLNFHKAPWPNATVEKLVPNYKYPHLHFVNLHKNFVNDKEVPVKPSWWQFGKKMHGGVVVDTGTTITHFPEDFYIIFRYIFRPEVGDIPIVENPVGDFDTCYQADLDGSEVYFPVVKLYFDSKSPGSMLFLAQERVVTLIGDQYCLAFKGRDKDFTVIGTNQLQAVGLTFDTSQNTLSFDLDACA